MTNYRIGPDSDHIDPQKRGRCMKLEFHCEYWADDPATVSGRKPTNPANGLGHVLKHRLQWRLTHLLELVETLRGLVKEQMNEAERAPIGVGPSETCIYVASTPTTSRKPSPSGAACPSAKSNAHRRTRRLLPYHPDDGTVDVHRR